MWYATHKTDSNHNSWVISRFASKGHRDAFVAKHDDQHARAVARPEAERIWRKRLLIEGGRIPPGGLLALCDFWNEQNPED